MTGAAKGKADTTQAASGLARISAPNLKALVATEQQRLLPGLARVAQPRARGLCFQVLRDKMAVPHGDHPFHSDRGAMRCKTSLVSYIQETENDLYETWSMLHFLIVTE